MRDGKPAKDHKKGPAQLQATPSLGFLCLNALRLEAGDSRLQDESPRTGGKGTLVTSLAVLFCGDANPGWALSTNFVNTFPSY